MEFEGMSFNVRFAVWLIQSYCGHRTYSIESARDDIYLLICGGEL